MIRLLGAHDHAAAMGLLQREPEINLFIIGDIENAGYDHEQVCHWGQFDRRGRLLAILTRYFDSLVFYSREDYDQDGFLQLIGSLEWRFFSAADVILDPLAARIPFARRRDTLLARLAQPLPEAVSADSRPAPRPAMLNDVPGIVMLREKIVEFDVVPDAGMLYHTFKNKEGRAWIIEEGVRVVAVAQSAAESRALAMIVGVCTHPDRRQRGFATACMARLCRQLLAEGKTPCLFYDNPEAGRIYRRLGFEDLGRWSMLVR